MSTASSTATPAPDNLHLRDSKYYFDDGSIVLSAYEDPSNIKGQLLLFRVHKSLLAAESAVFATMFALPVPSMENQESYDGLPKVHLHDKADHIRDFLTAIYRSQPSFKERYLDDVADALIGPLLIAEKYAAIKLKQRLIAFIEENWFALDYKAWKVREDFISSEHATDVNPESTIRLSRAANIRAVIPKTLSYVYYRLSIFPLHRFIPSLLEADDIIYIMTGRQAIQAWIHESIKDQSGDPPFVPCSDGACDVKHFTDALLLSAYESKNRDILEWWENQAEVALDHGLPGLCPSMDCRKNIWRWLYGLVSDAFDMIPTFFPIAVWDNGGVRDTDA